MKRFLTPLISCLLLVGSAAASDVYVTYDERGRPIYSDRPLSADSRALDVRSAPTDPALVAAEQEALQEREAESQRRAEEAALLAGLSGDEAARRLEQCRRARETAATYETAQRLYEALPDGGRRYLSDEELDQAREKAQQDIARYCSTP
jgi:hypothetical protein